MIKIHFPNSENFPVRRKGCSVAKLCLTLCDPIDYSTSDFLVIFCLPKFAQIHVHWLGPQSSPPLELIPMTRLLASSGQSIGASASASVLPINTQGRSLGLTGLISLLSKELSRVFSSLTVQKHRFFSAQLPLWSNSHIPTWLMEK